MFFSMVQSLRGGNIGTGCIGSVRVPLVIHASVNRSNKSSHILAYRKHGSYLRIARDSAPQILIAFLLLHLMFIQAAERQIAFLAFRQLHFHSRLFA